MTRALTAAAATAVLLLLEGCGSGTAGTTSTADACSTWRGWQAHPPADAAAKMTDLAGRLDAGTASGRRLAAALSRYGTDAAHNRQARLAADQAAVDRLC